MQGNQEIKINKHVSKAWKCTKCGDYLVYWKTKNGDLVYECEKCGWAKVEWKRV